MVVVIWMMIVVMVVVETVTRIMIKTPHTRSMIRIPGTEVQSSPAFHPQSENLLRGSKPCQVLLWGDFGKLKSPTMNES